MGEYCCPADIMMQPSYMRCQAVFNIYIVALCGDLTKRAPLVGTNDARLGLCYESLAFMVFVGVQQTGGYELADEKWLGVIVIFPRWARGGCFVPVLVGALQIVVVVLFLVHGVAVCFVFVLVHLDAVGV